MELETDKRGRERQFASLITLLQPDRDAWDLWLNAMASGDYRFGFGLLRSADDEYDPWGVLVMLNGGQWVWDEAEEAWAFRKSAVALEPIDMVRWLGCQRANATPLETFQRAQQGLTTLVSALADTVSDFGSVVSVLRAAHATSMGDRERLIHAIKASTSFGASGPDAVDRSVDIFSRSPFYGRR